MIVCDRCKSETTNSFSISYRYIDEDDYLRRRSKHFTLCSKCLKEIKTKVENYINGSDEE